MQPTSPGEGQVMGGVIGEKEKMKGEKKENRGKKHFYS